MQPGTSTNLWSNHPMGGSELPNTCFFHYILVFGHATSRTIQLSMSFHPASLEASPHKKFATVAGSHMNQVCRLWHAHMKHPSPLLTDGQGRLSLEKLCNEDPEYHRAVSQGMEWQIISHLVPKEIPEFCALVIQQECQFVLFFQVA